MCYNTHTCPQKEVIIMALGEGLITKLDFGERKVFSTDYFSGDYNQTLYIKKSVDDGSGRDKYYLQLYTLINGEPVMQGFIYFYLDFKNSACHFIGMRVIEQYRNLNIGSLLVSVWIDFCLNYGIEYIGVNHKQNKPFLLYMLKKYSFDVFDLNLYKTRSDVITICRSVDLKDTTKYLMFKDKRHQKNFIQTNSFKADNYKVIEDLLGCYDLDQVILPLQDIRRNPVDYYLQDKEYAAYESTRVLTSHRK